MALLDDWVQSLEGGLIPEAFFSRMAQIPATGADEYAYELVLEMPEPVRDTVLYLLRFAWTLSLVQKSVRNDCSDLPTAQRCVQLLLGKKSIFDGQGKDASYLRFVLGVLHCIAVRPREAFLPEDPTAEELERFKVLLYSGIAPLCREGPPYRYTLENLYRLESTAATMFQFELLPETNTFGCSVHRLPKPPVGRLALFLPRDRMYVKCATTRVYKLGHFWIGPFLDRVLFSCEDGPVQSLPLSAITVSVACGINGKRIMDSPPDTLLEYERQRIQGRCLSIVGETIEQSFDVVLRTSERRNELLNVLDLYLEWGKEELESIWDELREVSKEDVVGEEGRSDA